ncbi:unnamed protein product [Closterium sp. Naga37s-1]|nr:unnamed protein product [Closterium sp. Naga37s-1]
MTFEHVRDAAIRHPDVAQHLLALVNTVLVVNLSKEAARLLTASRLFAFSKPEGGTRPIAVGEVIHRVNAKAALLIAAPFARRHFAPIHPMGPPVDCATFQHTNMAEAVDPAPLLSLLEPQLCPLLLTRCINCRISYLLRTTPPDSLPFADWGSWGEGNFHTFLTFADIPLPRHRAEQLRTCAKPPSPLP